MERGLGRGYHLGEIKPVEVKSTPLSETELRTIPTRTKFAGKIMPKTKMPEIQLYLEHVNESLRKMNEIYERLKKMPR